MESSPAQELEAEGLGSIVYKKRQNRTSRELSAMGLKAGLVLFAFRSMDWGAKRVWLGPVAGTSVLIAAENWSESDFHHPF
jgi:hypothetical protein